MGVRIDWSGEVIATGAEGLFYLVGLGGEVTSCRVTPSLALALHGFGPVVTPEGRVYTTVASGAWCEITTGPTSNLLGMSYHYCGLSPNLALLTPDTLYAPLGLDCFID